MGETGVLMFSEMSQTQKEKQSIFALIYGIFKTECIETESRSAFTTV
jgi:hypothetical protein